MNRLIGLFITSKKSNTAHGICSSNRPISLENLFIIRPSGFVSKNLIGADITLLNIFLCRFLEALRQIV